MLNSFYGIKIKKDVVIIQMNQSDLIEIYRVFPSL